MPSSPFERSDRSDGFAINPELDLEGIAAGWRRNGRIQIRNFLSPTSAAFLRDELGTTTAWRHLINGTDKVFEMAPSDYDALPTHTRLELDRSVNAVAARAFQFSFDSIRVDDDPLERQRSRDPLAAFAQFLASPESLAMLGYIVGVDDLNFADVQATRYRVGDFLTRHDDVVEGKHRVAAYVLGLVEEWRAEWGGLLMFVNPNDHVDEVFIPAFNTLSLFAVGQPHFVSPVAPYAAEPRLAVTGWLRRLP